MLNARRLRHVVDIEKPEGKDDFGAVIPATWVPWATGVYAAIDALSGKEYIAARTVASKITGRITVRKRAGLKADMRVIHRNDGEERIYSIEAILPDNDSGNEYVTLLVSTGVNDG